MDLTLIGEVVKLVFENEKTGFRVVQLEQVEGSAGLRRVIIVGRFSAIEPGMRVRVSGRLVRDPKRGEQLQVESLVVLTPDTQQGLERFLASGVIPGLGPRLAARIVKYFGAGTLEMLDRESHRLLEVPGIGQQRVEEIRKAWMKQREMSNLLLALQGAGVSPALADRLMRRYGSEAQEVVERTPYRLAWEVPGVGFKTADTLALAQGRAPDSPERVQAGIGHELRQAADQGHCYLLVSDLRERVRRLLQVEAEVILAAEQTLVEQGRVVREGERLFLRSLHQAEVEVAERFGELLRAPSASLLELAPRLEDFEQKQGLRLASGQREAVLAVLKEKVVVITGGPGVGKTTLVRALLATLAGKSLRIHLAAPTGRAAKRLADSTEHSATTLHRLLEVEAGTGRFQRDADRPLETDLLIVDEASMIDVHLMGHLLAALPRAARLVLVGDADQLPSVGPGAILRDVIHSQALPVVRLDVIFRQEEASGILVNAQRILRGEEPVGAEDAEGDFFVIHPRDPEQALALVGKLVKERIPQRFGLDARKEVQVLTPLHRGRLGTVALNEMLQNLLNPPAPEEDSNRESRFRVGDKVMQTRNNYEKEVFNGDVGEITHEDGLSGKLSLSLEEAEGPRTVIYERGEQSELALAYALSIHKSQGSEYPAVVLLAYREHAVLLSRNLIYTAVTRARQVCVLVCEPGALRMALAETRKESRHTALAERLSAVGSAC